MNTNFESVTIERNTKETNISLELSIYGSQQLSIDTGLPFFDHMLTQLALHSGWDLTITARGDIEVDDHHLIEDVAITLGQAFQQAWRAVMETEGLSLQRYGQRLLPMDATLTMIAVDICGRPYAVTNLPFTRETVGNVATEMWPHFFYSFAINAAISLHIKSEYFDNNHHLVESSFKGLAFAIKEALRITQTENSSKGVL